VAVIPARGGSKGLPGKNLMKVQGISLIARAVLMAKRIPEIKWIIVSTDEKATAREAEWAGASIPFMRPESLAQDDTPMIAVLKHALGWFESSVKDADSLCQGVVLLQPTSPMRKFQHVTGAMALYHRLKNEGMDFAGIHTVSPVPEEYCPWNLWQLKTKTAEESHPEMSHCLLKKRDNGSNQPRLLYRNGAAVVLDVERLNGLTLAQGPVLPYVIEESIITIDTLHDLLTIEHCGRRLEPDTGDVEALLN
jgi:N-acylneuraminate cytidylyltransferase